MTNNASPTPHNGRPPNGSDPRRRAILTAGTVLLLLIAVVVLGPASVLGVVSAVAGEDAARRLAPCLGR